MGCYTNAAKTEGMHPKWTRKNWNKIHRMRYQRWHWVVRRCCCCCASHSLPLDFEIVQWTQISHRFEIMPMSLNEGVSTHILHSYCLCTSYFYYHYCPCSTHTPNTRTRKPKHILGVGFTAHFEHQNSKIRVFLDHFAFHFFVSFFFVRWIRCATRNTCMRASRINRNTHTNAYITWKRNHYEISSSFYEWTELNWNKTNEWMNEWVSNMLHSARTALVHKFFKYEFFRFVSSSFCFRLMCVRDVRSILFVCHKLHDYHHCHYLTLVMWLDTQKQQQHNQIRVIDVNNIP